MTLEIVCRCRADKTGPPSDRERHKRSGSDEAARFRRFDVAIRAGTLGEIDCSHELIGEGCKLNRDGLSLVKAVEQIAHVDGGHRPIYPLVCFRCALVVLLG